MKIKNLCSTNLKDQQKESNEIKHKMIREHPKWQGEGKSHKVRKVMSTYSAMVTLKKRSYNLIKSLEVRHFHNLRY